MKIKLAVCLVLALFTFIFITQNTATVTVAFLVWSIEMSLVLLLFIMLGTGVILGWLLHSYVRFRGQRKPIKSTGKMPDPAKTTSAEPASREQTRQKEEHAP